MKRKSEFEHIYSLYEYEALAKEQSRGFVLMPTADSLQKPKSAAEIELIISKQNEFDRLHAERVIEHDSNLTSLNRKPSEKLYLLVKIPGALNWQFPFKRTTEEETEVPLYKISEGNFADIVGGACEYYHVARTPIASSQSPNEYVNSVAVTVIYI